MYTPSFRVKGSGVPILSKKEIDAIGEHFVQDFQPEVLTDPSPVDIESFIECYLGMTQDYQYLSHNGIYLGMTVFNDTNKVVVYSPAENRAEYISAKARTVIIDNRLLEENQEHRYRFTLGHEGSHDILHSGFFSYDPNQISMFDSPMAPMIQCRVDNPNADRRTNRAWDDHDWMEWQANRLSSAILMPESAVRLVASRYSRAATSVAERWHLVEAMISSFNVSFEAATYRLKELGVIPQSEKTDQAQFTAFLDFAPVVGV